MTRPQVTDGDDDFHLTNTAADSMADSRQGWSSSLGLDENLETPDCNKGRVMKYSTGPRTDYLERSMQQKMDTGIGIWNVRTLYSLG
jgi:hypothetical protein